MTVAPVFPPLPSADGRRLSFQDFARRHAEIGVGKANAGLLRPLLLSEESPLLTKRDDLKSKLAALRQGRLVAAEQVRGLGRRELSEIKKLAQAPPEAVRRTLGATWLLLNASRFRGMPAIAVKWDDSAKDWRRVQRMVADEAFVDKVLDFDIGNLAECRHVAEYVASQYLGLELEVKLEVKKAEKPPLQLKAVKRASTPCGVLLLWLRQLLQDLLEREVLEAELELCEEQIRAEVRPATWRTPRQAEKETVMVEMPRRLSFRALKETVELPPPLAPATPRPRSPRRLEALVLSPVTVKAAPPPLHPPCRIELHVTGCLETVGQQLSKCRVQFPRNEYGLDSASPALSKVVTLMKEHRGRLKLRLLGHRERGEDDLVDLRRGEAVFQWLSNSEGLAPGLLRSEGVAMGNGCGGRSVVAVAIKELVPLYGPISAEVAANSAPCGLYFEARSSMIGPETLAILACMATWLRKEGVGAIIEGHADHMESADLSGKRAEVVREELIRLGVSSTQLSTLSQGNAYPLSRMHSAPNRRVELHLQGFGGR